MLKYTIAMTVRFVCIGLCLFVPGWWVLIPAAGAIVLPYVAVVIANTTRAGTSTQVQRPGAVVLHRPENHT
jgi:hypothetical protein